MKNSSFKQYQQLSFDPRFRHDIMVSILTLMRCIGHSKDSIEPPKFSTAESLVYSNTQPLDNRNSPNLEFKTGFPGFLKKKSVGLLFLLPIWFKYHNATAGTCCLSIIIVKNKIKSPLLMEYVVQQFSLLQAGIHCVHSSFRWSHDRWVTQVPDSALLMSIFWGSQLPYIFSYACKKLGDSLQSKYQPVWGSPDSYC